MSALSGEGARTLWPVPRGRAVRGRSTLIGLLCVAVVAAGGVATTRDATAAVGPAAPVTEAATPAAALAAARSGGRPVEVLSARTETEQVFANPHGTFTLEQHLRPQRVRRADGTWAAIDTTLRRGADGTIAPVAALGAMAFSGGGRTAPLASIGPRGSSMQLWWPGVLPSPVLAGNVATYPELLPGVDLQITVEPDKFTHVFVVKDRRAALSAAVRRITLRTAVSGLKLQRAKGDRTEGVTASGQVVISGSAAVMWDSGDRAATGKAAEPRQARVATELGASKLTLVPDQRLLTDPKAVFPLHVDPSWAYTGGKQHHTILRKSSPNTSYYDRTTNIGSNDSTKGPIRSGYNYDDNGTYTDRSLFQMHMAGAARTRINRAVFTLYHSWSGSGCAGNGRGYWTYLYQVAPFDGGTVWNTGWNSGGSGWYGIVASTDAVRRYGESCSPSDVDFDITGHVQNLAGAGQETLWLGLRSASESNTNYWRRYRDDARLMVEYNSYPNTPTPVSTDGKACSAGSQWVTTDTPVLAATHGDRDNQSPLTTSFHWWDKNGGSRNETDKVAVAGSNPSASPVTVQIPSGRLQDGRTYLWNAISSDGFDIGQQSDTCEFKADLSAPNAVGSVSAATYNNTTPKGGPGIPDTFTFNPPATKADEVTGYAYTFDGGSPPASATQVNADPTSHAAVVSVSPPSDGPVTLRVWTRDRANRYSASAYSFPFQVAAGGLAARWTFEGSPGTADVTGNGNTLSFVGASTVNGRSHTAAAPNKAVAVSATAYATTANSPLMTKASGVPVAVRTDNSLTLAVWVKIDSIAATGRQAAVAINGANTASVMIGYGGDLGNKWIFRMVDGDVSAPSGTAVHQVLSDAAAVAGKWTHLTATYNGATKQMRLYVNGVLQTGAAAVTTGFNATGKLSVGAQLWNGPTYTNNFPGTVDDVALYNKIVAAADIQKLSVPLTPTVTAAPAGAVVPNTPVTVTFSANGDINVAKFVYGFAPIFNNEVTATGGVASIVHTPATAGDTIVYVKAKDTQNQLSALATITIKAVVNPNLVGLVTDQAGNTVAGATVLLNPGARTTTTDNDGYFEFLNVPVGDYDLTAYLGTRCGQSTNTSLRVDHDVEQILALSPTLVDGYGYVCATQPRGAFQAATTAVALTGDDALAQIATPFPIPFYGQSVTTLWIDTNGAAYSTNPGAAQPVGAALPNRAAPNGVIAPYWADLVVDGTAGVHTATLGSAPNRQFVIEWRNVALKSDLTKRLSFQALLGEDGTVHFRYQGVDAVAEQGAAAVVGMESRFGSDGTGYSAQEAVLADAVEIRFTHPVNPTPLPTHRISGTVTAAGTPTAGVTVTLDPLGTSTVTDAAGAYAFDDLPEGDYHVTAQLCLDSGAADVTLTGDTTHDFALTQEADAFGYNCTVRTQAFIPADQSVYAMTGDDVIGDISFPFPVPLYGEFRSTARISTNGFLALVGTTNSAPHHSPIPSDDQPNGVIAAFWDDLVVDEQASIRTAVLGTAPHRQFVVEWRNVTHYDDPTMRLSFEIILGEDGEVSFAYTGLDSDRERGGTAMVGLENLEGTSGRVVSVDQPILQEDEAIAFPYPGGVPAATSTLTGSVTVGGAVMPGGVSIVLDPDRRTAVSDANGNFSFTGLLPGTYGVTAFHCGKSVDRKVTVGETGSAGTLSLPPPAGDGYTCAQSNAAFIHGDTQLALEGDDAFEQVTTPFPINFYGQTVNSFSVNTDGVIFLAENTNVTIEAHAWIPNAAYPNGLIAPFWDDFTVYKPESAVYVKTIGTAPHRQFVVEWRAASFYNAVGNPRMSAEVIFSENGQITFNYDGLDGWRESGENAVVGLESPDGTTGFDIGFRASALIDGRAITFTPIA